jgi:hypothetical protein
MQFDIFPSFSAEEGVYYCLHGLLMVVGGCRCHLKYGLKNSIHAWLTFSEIIILPDWTGLDALA